MDGYEEGTDAFRYKFHDEKKTWQEAKRKCGMEGANLAMIKSKETREYVETKYVSPDMWIGLSDLRQEGEFEFLDGSQPDASTTTSWWPGQPSGGTRYNCVETNFNGKPGRWNDDSCSAKYKFLCQKSKSGLVWE